MGNGYLGRQAPNTTSLHLCPALYAEHDVTYYGISLWSVGLSFPSCAPPQLLVHSQPPGWWGGGRGRTSNCASTAQRQLKQASFITLFPAQIKKHSPVPVPLKKTTLSQPKSVQVSNEHSQLLNQCITKSYAENAGKGKSLPLKAFCRVKIFNDHLFAHAWGFGKYAYTCSKLNFNQIQ